MKYSFPMILLMVSGAAVVLFLWGLGAMLLGQLLQRIPDKYVAPAVVAIFILVASWLIWSLQ